MSNNKFWKMAEINKDNTVLDTGSYLLVVTPTLWRELARSDTDRNLGEFSIVNKVYGTVESSANNLPLALSTVKALQSALNELEDKGKPNNVTSLRTVPKDNAE
uniref:Uncharacterized protein n=3 Tax=unclassified bacterial viruses TaxID=12333 RepID=A0AAU6VZG6_9VIRU